MQASPAARAHARIRFNCLHKAALRDQLYVEQHHLCVFCEQEIREGNSTPPIDHWHPLEHNPEEVFLWENLHLSCTTPDTCDTRKHNTPLKWDPTDPDLPWPSQMAYEEVLGFTSGGKVYVRKDATLDGPVRRALELAIEDRQEGVRTKRSILNLNAPALREARAAALDDEEEAVSSEHHNQHLTTEQRLARAEALLAAARHPGFISIRIASLLGTIGAGR